MNSIILTEQINNTADKWMALAEMYNIDVLLAKPDVQSWSLGQVAMHIVTETNLYIKEVEKCLHSNENVSEKMTQEAQAMFDRNSFPDIRIARDASLSQVYLQPESKPDILENMRRLKVLLGNLLQKTETSSYSGKTRHPGLGYFNAQEWIQFAEMHMRHHLAQADRIKAALQLR